MGIRLSRRLVYDLTVNSFVRNNQLLSNCKHRYLGHFVISSPLPCKDKAKLYLWHFY